MRGIFTAISFNVKNTQNAQYVTQLYTQSRSNLQQEILVKKLYMMPKTYTNRF